MHIDFTTISGVNAVLVFLGTLVSIVYSLSTTRKIGREQIEQTRREWTDIVTEREKRIEGMQLQINDLQKQLLTAFEKLGILSKQNDFLMERNVELQETCAGQSRELRLLRGHNKMLTAVLNRHGIDVPEMALA